MLGSIYIYYRYHHIYELIYTCTLPLSYKNTSIQLLYMALVISFQEKLQKLDKYIGKILKALPENTMMTVVLSGRTETNACHNGMCFVKITWIHVQIWEIKCKYFIYGFMFIARKLYVLTFDISKVYPSRPF